MQIVSRSASQAPDPTGRGLASPSDAAPGQSRREFLRATIGAAATVGTVAVLDACGSATPAVTTKQAATSGVRRGGNLIAGLAGGGSTDTLDAQNPIVSPDFARTRQLYNSLVEFDANVVPQLSLAESITPNSDATEWTIRVKRGITFHNGKSLTADDVIFSFKRITDPKAPLPGAASLLPLDVGGMRKLDKYTVRLPCRTPFSTFLETMPCYYYAIVPEGYDPKHPVGTGPFMYKSFTPGQQSVFVRNPHYFQNGADGKPLPYVDSLTITDFSDEQSQQSALLSGQVHVVDSLTATTVAPIRSGGQKVLISDSGLFIPFLMRTDVAPFSDVRVRQALRLVVNRPQMLKTVWGGYGTVGNDLFARYDPAYDHSLPQRVQDLEKAKFLLKQAGHEGLTVSLATGPGTYGWLESAQVLKQQAAGAGVNVAINNLTNDALDKGYLKWPFTQTFWYYNPYFPQVAQATISTAELNETHFHNARYDALYKQALASTSEARRTEIAHEMQQIDYTEGGYIIQSFSGVIDGYRTNVMGLRQSRTGLPLGGFAFDELWLSS